LRFEKITDFSREAWSGAVLRRMKLINIRLIPIKVMANLGCALLTTPLLVICVLGLMLFPSAIVAQTSYDLTVDVLVNSSNTTGYDTDPNNPGEYQRYPERYLENLQIPYRVIDVSTTPPPSTLNNVQLIIAGHKGLNFSTAWQQAITAAVAGGVGFVNLDSDPAIGNQSHIQAIFRATGSIAGTAGESIIVPAAVQPGGATPHYIAGMQLHFLSDPPGDLTYSFHGDGISSYPQATSTILQGASGTAVAYVHSGQHSTNDPLILATTYGLGSAVHFGTYDYLRADRFGFNLGVDDLFWRSLVWAARKPFVIRAYPRFFSVQLDDNDEIDSLFATRIQHFWDTSLTGTVLPDGTGGPWKIDTYINPSTLDIGGGNSNTDRDLLISEAKAGNIKIGPHRNTDIYGGDLFWNSDIAPLTDSGWQAALAVALQEQQGNGGSDTLPYSRSNIPEFWNYSNNVGYDLWHTLGARYILEIQEPGAVYYSTTPKTNAQRLPFHPYRVYEQPPSFGNQDETLPFFWADYYTIGSRAGQPAQTFFGFSSQVLSDNFRFPGPDAKFPDFSGAGSFPVANSVENWEVYAWRFWSSLTPVTIFTHDQNDYSNTPDSERAQFVSQLSTWLNANGAIHTFVENQGDYLLARRTSTLSGGQVTTSTITLNLTGQATDFDGNLIPTKALVFYGNDNGSWVNVPGFGPGGTTVSFPNATPPSILLSKSVLSFAAVPGTNPASQQVTVSNGGGGTLTWFATSNATWLSVSPTGGTNAGLLTVTVNSASLASGTYTSTIALSAIGATNSPQYINVSLVVGPTTIATTPTSLSFTAFQNQGNPATQTLSLTNAGGGSLNWSATSSVPWLTVSPTSGAAPSTLTVAVNTTGLGIGTFSGTITLTSSQAKNSPQTVPVTLTIIGVLMGDNFASGSLAGWAYSPLGLASNWSVSNGAVQYNGGGHTQIYAGNSSWANYTVQASIKLASLANYPGGVRGRVNPTTGGSYAVWLYPNSSLIRLYSTQTWNIDAGYAQLGQASLTFDATNSHTVALSMQGTTLQVLYDGNVVITATDSTYASGMIALDVSNQPISFANVAVTGVASSSASLALNPSTVNFAWSTGGSAPPAQSVQLSTTGTGNVAWSATTSASWISASPSTGTTPASLQVSVNTSGLTTGNYSGTISLVSLGAANSPQTINVNLSVTTPPPVLNLSQASYAFSGGLNGTAPPSQPLTIQTAGLGSYPWSAASDSAWLAVSTASGTTPSTIQILVNPAGLAQGTYNGNLTITAAGLSGSPTVISVSLSVYALYALDNFSTNTLDGWAYSPLALASGWSVANQAVQYNGGGATQLYAGNSAWADYNVQAGIQLSNLNNYPGGIRGRVQPTTGGSYAVWLYPGYQQIRLYMTNQWNIDNGFTTLGTATLVGDATKFHTVKLSMVGSQINVYYDGQLMITATDTTYASGMVAFDVSNQPITFDNVLVTGSTAVSGSLSPSTNSLSFSGTHGGASPTAQNVQLQATGSGTLAWSAATTASWLTVTPSAGTTPAALQVSANTTGLSTGTYTATVRLASLGDSASPEDIIVTLTVQ
jgi:hypothetical protein